MIDPSQNFNYGTGAHNAQLNKAMSEMFKGFNDPLMDAFGLSETEKGRKYSTEAKAKDKDTDSSKDSGQVTLSNEQFEKLMKAVATVRQDSGQYRQASAEGLSSSLGSSLYNPYGMNPYADPYGIMNPSRENDGLYGNMFASLGDDSLYT